MRTRLAVLVVLCAAASAQRDTLNIHSPSQTGVASWYGKHEQGKRMANGERFDRNKYTAASRTFPLGTCLQVTYPRTGITVIVIVTDRGPWTKSRVLDLSERSAQALGLKSHGVGQIEIQVAKLQFKQSFHEILYAFDGEVGSRNQQLRTGVEILPAFGRDKN